MAKRKQRVPSQTTPGHKMQVRSWLAELVMLRRHQGRLPPYFWRENKWKWRYTNEVKAASKFIKAYGEPTVTKVVCREKRLETLTSYGDLEFLLQAEQESLRQLALPKDLSEAPPVVKTKGPDLRPTSPISQKKTLFDTLAEFEKE